MDTLDHIGIAVFDLEKSIEDYKKNFGFEVHSRETLESAKVSLVFLKLKNTLIELITPTDKASKLQKYLDANGEGLHHLCYRVNDIRAELKRLESLGHTLIDKEPRQGAHGSIIAFVHPKTLGGVLTELCEYPK